MDFSFDQWGQNEAAALEKYLRSISHPENAEWENRIVRTSYPLLSTYTKELRAVAKSIAKGDALSFLSLTPTCHEEVVLQGLVLGEIKDANEQMRLLPAYLAKCDSWAQTDSLKFRITSKNEDKWFDFAVLLTRSKNTFERRCGLLIFFKMLDGDKLAKIFDTLKGMKNESEYYVNMAMAWLVCDAFIKRREETLAFLGSGALSAWTQNKAISKCRDSFRVSHEDKALLLSLKK